MSDEAEFSLRADHVVAILEPRDSVAEGWRKLVYPEPETPTDENVTDEPATDATEPAPVEDGATADSAE